MPAGELVTVPLPLPAFCRVRRTVPTGVCVGVGVRVGVRVAVRVAVGVAVAVAVAVWVAAGVGVRVAPAEKAAVTSRSASRVTVQVGLVPWAAQAPPQPVKVAPAFGLAVSVTLVPGG